jgi:hypothetical protein
MEDMKGKTKRNLGKYFCVFITDLLTVSIVVVISTTITVRCVGIEHRASFMAA